jgi:signal transduction histidine kinase
MSKPLLLFYILVIYVILQFSWWAYLIIDLNHQVLENRFAITALLNQETGDLADEKIAMNKELQQKIRMVYGEGFVFLVLLIFGMYKIRRAFHVEFALARQQKNFLLSITHEFKSPLAAIKLNLQTLQKRGLNLNATQTEGILHRSLIETERIHELVENVLLAARLENQGYEIIPEEIPLSSFLQDLVEHHRLRQNRLHHFRTELTEGVVVSGDRLALSSLFNNLLENAEKYAPEGTEITLRLTQVLGEAIVSVEDQGPGIPDNERTHIFKKFYRIGNEDTRKTKGTGLGLYIAQHIVSLHHGKIVIRSGQPTGSVFEVRIPLRKNTKPVF